VKASSFDWLSAQLPFLNRPQRVQVLGALHPATGLDREALLVTDANAAYGAFARQHGIAHEAVNLRARERVRTNAGVAIHVQDINAYHRRFANGWRVSWRRLTPAAELSGWHWALDGGWVTSVEQLLRIAINIIHSER
jgi:hypothetical protein